MVLSGPRLDLCGLQTVLSVNSKKCLTLRKLNTESERMQVKLYYVYCIHVYGNDSCTVGKGLSDNCTKRC